ncbi:MAG: hydroxymethylbilane synthase, partial [Rhodospirillales bacterium]
MIPLPLRIGTRGSPLALAQTEEARRRLAASSQDLAQPDAIEVVVVRTTGDAVLDRPLAEIGGKGLFTKELDEAMLTGRIDVAVHSVKDLPTSLPGGIVLAATLPREDPRDVLVCGGWRDLAHLPAGAVVGTASLRRKAQLLHRRPDLAVVPLRGNVHTRLDKVARGEVAATVLALAGLRRLGLAEAAANVLAPEEMLPAVGQGAVGLTCRRADDPVRALLAAVDDASTTTRVTTERALLAVL